MGDKEMIEPRKVTIHNKAHLLFALEYLRTLDGMGSYRSVYEKPGQTMSDSTARVGASRILGMENVQEYMDYIIFSEIEVAGRVGINPGRVITELGKMAMEPSYKNPTVKLRALELYGRAMGVLGDGELYDGLEKARQRHIEDYNRRINREELKNDSEGDDLEVD